jgi:hypothetical protein
MGRTLTDAGRCTPGKQYVDAKHTMIAADVQLTFRFDLFDVT